MGNASKGDFLVPSGGLLAARPEGGKWALAGLFLILSFVVTMTYFGLLHHESIKSVTLVDEGQATRVLTHADEVGELLAEQAIEIGPYDRLSVPLDADVEDGGRIEIDRAREIAVRADGLTRRVYTLADTVGEALAEAGIALAPSDRVTPSQDTGVTDGMTVRVVRVTREIVETEHPIAYKIIKKKDGSLPLGKEKVVQSGREGVLVKRTELVYEDGVLVAERELSSEVAKPSVDRIIAVGTRKPEVAAASYNASEDEVQTVTLDGISVQVRRVLKNVKLTAYSAGPASTGKTPDHPYYGITSTGVKVQEGRTIAVDPDVIPLGWWVYIEGFGFRRAEDTGSAVKGKVIDIYFDSEETAERFGTKKGYTVYVIGPVKPTTD
ncbi:MAG TPA: ubiquitin-like domain-containing protein [Paenibacillaceae bacterium]